MDQSVAESSQSLEGLEAHFIFNITKHEHMLSLSATVLEEVRCEIRQYPSAGTHEKVRNPSNCFRIRIMVLVWTEWSEGGRVRGGYVSQGL